MRRKFLIMASAAVLSLGLLTGCSGNTQGKDSAQSEAKTEEGAAQEEESAGEGDVISSDEAPEDLPVADEEEGAEMFGSGEEGTVLNTDEPLSGKHHVDIVIQDHGTISVELDADAAPVTVTNFVKLAQEDFYDGLTFHRIIDGFMMQGGDPLGNGTGGSSETIVGEFSDNGIDNELSHTRGAISMARSSAPDSASSQFFIVQTDSTFLDGSYAAFGYVTEGMEIVDEICKAAGTEDRTIPAEEQPVIEDIIVID